METAAKQFVISEHTTKNGVHWDLMLEMHDYLWTWRLNVPPEKITDTPVSAEPIFDHSPRFLTYEGPVQNGTGRVKIADKGTCTLSTVIPTGTWPNGMRQCEAEEPIETASQSDSSSEQYQPECLTLNLLGTILKGTFTLSKTPDAPFWTLQLNPDKKLQYGN